MDIFVVDPNTWFPTGAPLYYYDTLIWTEKFLEPSEFELTTQAIREIREVLSLGTLVSVRQSKEVMMVEKQVVDTDENGVETLTISGRSVSSYLEHRVVGEKREQKYELPWVFTALESGFIVIYNSLINDQAYDYTTKPPASAYYKNPLDAIPNAILTDSTEQLQYTPTRISRFVTPGRAIDVVKPWFADKPYGFRVVRPPYSSIKITVDSEGKIVKTPVTDTMSLSFDVFHGVDRSHGQTDNTPVILDVQHDDLMLPNYVLSIAQFKNEAHISLTNKAVFAYSHQIPDEGDPPMDQMSGLDRRVRFVDGGTPEDGVNEADYEVDAVKTAEELLEDNHRFAMVDGGVSPQSAIKYGVDYHLGDLVTVRGNYGTMTKTRVTEYIRTEDATGEESYPTLVYS